MITTTSASGATRRFGIRGRAARLAPPEPFAGRARFRDGRLTGNIRVTLPGEGTARLAPGRAVLGTLGEIDIPRCLPPYFVSIAGRSAVEQAIATAVQRAALTRTARRALSALGGR